MPRLSRKRSFLRALLLFLLQVASVILAVEAKSREEIREEILGLREKRRVQLENVMARLEKELEDHESGVTPMAEKKLEHSQSKMKRYVDQLKELSRELDEEEINHRVDRHEQVLNQREQRAEL